RPDAGGGDPFPRAHGPAGGELLGRGRGVAQRHPEVVRVRRPGRSRWGGRGVAGAGTRVLVDGRVVRVGLLGERALVGAAAVAQAVPVDLRGDRGLYLRGQRRGRLLRVILGAGPGGDLAAGPPVGVRPRRRAVDRRRAPRRMGGETALVLWLRVL